MDILLLLMTIDKGECQIPKKMTIITKLATPRHAHCPSQQLAEDGTLGKHNDSSNLSDIFAQCGRMISPLLEKKPSQQGLSWQ